MPRIKIQLPETLPFSLEVDLRVTDMNYGSHLGNDALLGLLHEARWRFLRAHGLLENNCDGTTMIMADVAIAYRAEAFAGDRLRFEVGIDDVSRVGCNFVYRVTRCGDGELIAEAKTGIVFLNPDTRRPTAVPAKVLALR